MQMIPILLRYVSSAVKYLLVFLTALVLGIAGTILYALPWLLRAAAVFIWLAAAFVGIQTIQTLYSPTTDSSIPIFALKFAVIFLMVAWVSYAFEKEIQIWGALVVCGLLVWATALGALWLAEHWTYANLFFGVLPTLVFAVGMFSEAAHLRRKKKLHTKTMQPEIVEGCAA
jgi:hypothetical protein